MALNRVAQSLRKPSLSLRTKHKKLDENWTDNADQNIVKDGVSYLVRYLGMSLVEQPQGDESEGQGVRRIQDLLKYSMAKCEKVQLQVSPEGIRIVNVGGDVVKEEINVMRISYCSADKSNPKIFSYVARNDGNDALECRAYMCANKKEAESLTLTVALSFKIAYELNKSNMDENVSLSIEPDKIEQDKGQTKFGTIISQISEIRKYQRLSSSGEQQDVADVCNAQLNSDSSSIDDNPFTSQESSPKETPSVDSPVFEDFVEPQKPKSLKLMAQSPIVISLLPPPKSGKSSPLRTRFSPHLNVDVKEMFEQHPVTKKTDQDVENWDAHFEQLAVSRHRNSESDLLDKKETSPSYPRSNPFTPTTHNPFVVN